MKAFVELKQKNVTGQEASIGMRVHMPALERWHEGQVQLCSDVWRFVWRAFPLVGLAPLKSDHHHHQQQQFEGTSRW